MLWLSNDSDRSCSLIRRSRRYHPTKSSLSSSSYSSLSFSFFVPCDFFSGRKSSWRRKRSKVNKDQQKWNISIPTYVDLATTLAVSLIVFYSFIVMAVSCDRSPQSRPAVVSSADWKTGSAHQSYAAILPTHHTNRTNLVVSSSKDSWFVPAPPPPPPPPHLPPPRRFPSETTSTAMASNRFNIAHTRRRHQPHNDNSNNNNNNNNNNNISPANRNDRAAVASSSFYASSKRFLTTQRNKKLKQDSPQFENVLPPEILSSKSCPTCKEEATTSRDDGGTIYDAQDDIKKYAVAFLSSKLIISNERRRTRRWKSNSSSSSSSRGKGVTTGRNFTLTRQTVQCLILDSSLIVEEICSNSSSSFSVHHQNYSSLSSLFSSSAADKRKRLIFKFCNHLSIDASSCRHHHLTDDNNSSSLSTSVKEEEKAACERCLVDLNEKDRQASDMFETFETILRQYDCDDSYSEEWNCSNCKEAYKKWVCSVMITYPSDDVNETHHPIDECNRYSKMVENQCPYLSPHSEFQYAGEPVFLSTNVYNDEEDEEVDCDEESKLRSCDEQTTNHPPSPPGEQTTEKKNNSNGMITDDVVDDVTRSSSSSTAIRRQKFQLIRLFFPIFILMMLL